MRNNGMASKHEFRGIPIQLFNSPTTNQMTDKTGAGNYTQVKMLQSIIDDLESRYKKVKRELEETEADFRKIKTERDDLKLELATHNAKKDLEISAIRSEGKSGLGGIVDAIKDPNTIQLLAPILERVLMGRPSAASSPALAGGINLPEGVSNEKRNAIQFAVSQLASIQDQNKFNNLASLVINVASTTAFDSWLSDAINAMTSENVANQQTPSA